MNADLCPRCGTHPPRYPATYQGRTPLCLACYRERWQRKYRNRIERGLDDIPAADIERLFDQALQDIRRRRTWTSAHSS